MQVHAHMQPRRAASAVSVAGEIKLRFMSSHVPILSLTLPASVLSLSAFTYTVISYASAKLSSKPPTTYV